MKVAILTTFQEFIPGYSLTGIVKDQAEMLAKYEHEVHLFVSTKYHGEEFSDDVTLRKEIIWTEQKDYRSINDITPEHKQLIQDQALRLEELLVDFDIVFTHDFIFIGWFIPFGEACKRVSRKLPKLKWLHWIHSIPTGGRDYWDIRSYGPNHKIVYPNQTDRIIVAEAFRGVIDDVRTIPHIKDIRNYFRFSDETKELIDKYPGLIQADVVQILPASVDRLSAKRVEEVMRIFGEIKAQGRTVFLLIANQWATEKQQKQDVDKFRNAGVMHGLIDQQDFAFTSDFQSPKYDVGIPQRMIQELFLCSNLFVFPTREETFGLVVPEAGLSGVLMMLNRSLHMQIEVGGGAENALYFDFGSYTHEVNITNPKKYYRDLAFIILGRINQNESLMAKTFHRQTYNMDNLYRKYYLPTMSEAMAGERVQ